MDNQGHLLVASSGVGQANVIDSFPKDWRVTTISELFEIQQGKAVSPKTRQGKSPKPFLRTANVFWGYLDLAKVDQMDFTDEEAELLALRSGDLLVCEGGDIGRTALWEGQIERCMCQNHLHRLRKKSNGVEPLFFMYWMQAAMTQLGLYAGQGNNTTIPNLSKGILGAFAVPLPPLPEQRAVAYVLRTVQQAKEATEKVIAATGQLKQSLIRYVFTYGPVPTGKADQIPLKETEIGPVPGHWEVTSVGNGVIKGGGSLQTGPFGSLLHASDYVSDGIPFIMPKDLSQRAKINVESVAFIGVEDFQRLTRYHTMTGDLLVARRGELGRRGIVTEKENGWVCGSGCLRIRPGKLIQTPFLSYSFETSPARNWLASNAIGATMANLSTQILDRLPLAVPPLGEQQEIARLLAAVDNKIEAEQTRKWSLETIFKSLLQHLMTGKLRVHELELISEGND